jgi:hypothetical protein
MAVEFADFSFRPVALLPSASLRVSARGRDAVSGAIDSNEIDRDVSDRTRCEQPII